MPICANCGAPADARFCTKCASLLGTVAGGDEHPPAGDQISSSPAPTASMSDNVAGALCYALGFITGIVFLNLEPYSKRPSIRFHAFQAIFFSVGWIALSFALTTILLTLEAAVPLWYIFLPLRLLIGFAGFVLWLFCMYKAYTDGCYQLPVVGEFALKEATRR
jgi:uncharacterized membrane protein